MDGRTGQARTASLVGPPSRRLGCSLLATELAARAEDALQDCQPGGGGEEVDRVLQAAPRREGQPTRDHDDSLGAAAEADVALQPEQLRRSK